MENIEYWQYWRTLIFMSNINIKAIKIFIFTFFSNESVKLLHIMGGELSLTASKVAHNNNDAKFHRKAKYAQIHEYTFNTFSTCTPLKVLWPWTSLNKLKEQFNSRSGGTGAESYEYSKYPILPRAGWVKTLWNMSGGSEKNGDVAAGGVGAWRGGGGAVISQKAAPSSSVVAVDGIYCLSPSAIIPVPDSPFNYPVLFRTQSASQFLCATVNSNIYLPLYLYCCKSSFLKQGRHDQ